MSRLITDALEAFLSAALAEASPFAPIVRPWGRVIEADEAVELEARAIDADCEVRR